MLEGLAKQLAHTQSIFEKIAILDQQPAVSLFFQSHPFLSSFLVGLSPECELVLKKVAAINQADRLFAGMRGTNAETAALRALIEKLIAIDRFYVEMGGIVGYQAKILELLKATSAPDKEANYHSPSFVDISEKTMLVKEMVQWGIDALDRMVEIYPLGGAADRLLLTDETGMELPAAKLPFAGKTLLEHLICDLQAREHLYFQKTGRSILTPIAIMTSYEKNNYAHVIEIFEKANWFGRPKERIRFFTQPLVPTVNQNGDWCLIGPLKPLLKPGGHGAIWKMARDEGIFDWCEKQGCQKALIRQINNPIAGLDYGLLAFIGYGCKKDMTFGFASCPRLIQAAEGINVLIERGKQIVLTNVEYCDFAKFGIEDLPLKKGEPYSRFSSNTNILFADLQALKSAVDACPFPGLLLNLKNTAYTTESGEKKEELMARLESTMQNIADVFVEEKGDGMKTQATFVTYNERSKTISTAKRAYIQGGSLQETPENCFYDLLSENRNLLLKCGFSLPLKRSLREYMEKGPDCVFLYHPSLGPLYSIIQQKIRGGSLLLGSELLLEMANVNAVHLQVNGSLQIRGDQASSCILENVAIENRGVDWAASHPFWKMNLQRLETVQIILKGKSRFIAKDICLKGNQTFIVEDGQEIIL